MRVDSENLALSALPANSFLVHATNCLGVWGAGMARQLAEQFPAAFEKYKTFCHNARSSPEDRWPPRTQVGQCLIIPPPPSDVEAGVPAVHIVCLFTSYGYGRPGRDRKPGRDSRTKIIQQTGTALRRFRDQLAAMNASADEGKGRDFHVLSAKFNSKHFNVPWTRTLHLVQSVFEGFPGRWTLID